jgi:hypothetical protein
VSKDLLTFFDAIDCLRGGTFLCLESCRGRVVVVVAEYAQNLMVRITSGRSNVKEQIIKIVGSLHGIRAATK